MNSIKKLLILVGVGVAFACHVPARISRPQIDVDASSRPETLIVAGDIPPGRREAMLATARKFYQFWNTGNETLLREAISDEFIDHTLPPGRPQGPAGPAAAAKTFLRAVPDLKVVVAQQILAGDRVVSHLRFTGHFTGQLNGTTGASQPIDFIATDIVAVRDGRITDNWHLEDNLTFLQQVGLIPHQ
jgi:predicted ester cyclase